MTLGESVTDDLPITLGESVTDDLSITLGESVADAIEACIREAARYALYEGGLARRAMRSELLEVGWGVRKGDL